MLELSYTIVFYYQILRQLRGPKLSTILSSYVCVNTNVSENYFNKKKCKDCFSLFILLYK